MGADKNIVLSSDLVVHLDKHQVFKNNQLLKLPDLSYQVMSVLIKAYPEPVSINQMIDEVWEAIEVSPETVTQRIAMLRKVLSTSDDPNDKYILSIRNKGYRWVPDVKQQSGSKINMWVYGLAALMLVPSYFLIDFQTTKKPEVKKTVSSHATEDDYTRQAWHYLDKHEAKSNQLAVGLFRKSLEVRPNQMNALTGLSIALSHQVTKFNQPNDLLIEAKQVAEMAVSIDPNHARAWAALAFVYDASGDIDEAIPRYERALELDPDYPSCASSLSYLYGLKGQLVKALKLSVQVLGTKRKYLDLQIASLMDLMGFDAIAEQWYKKADELAPDNVFTTHVRARYYVSRNQYQLAKEVINAATERGIQRPELPVVDGIIAWIQGDSYRAQSAFEQAVMIDEADNEAQVWLFMHKHSSGTSEEKIEKFASQWFSNPSSWPDFWVLKALFYAHFSDHETALNSMETAYLNGYRNHRWLNQLPPFQIFHANAKWLKLIEDMQNDVSKQRQEIVQADWLPTSFLDPQN